MSRHGRQDGIGLIELVFVILVLGLLAGLALPNYNALKLKAEYAAIETALRTIELGMERYHSEHSAYFPTSGRRDVPRGEAVAIPEIDLALPEGHLHRYVFYTLPDEETGLEAQRYYVLIYSDLDFDGDGRNDVIITTLPEGEGTTTEGASPDEVEAEQTGREDNERRLWRFGGVNPGKKGGKGGKGGKKGG